MVVMRGSLKEWERLRLPNMIGRFENTGVSPDPVSSDIPGFGMRTLPDLSAPATFPGVGPVATAMGALPTELTSPATLPSGVGPTTPTPARLTPTVTGNQAQFNPQLLQLFEMLKRAYGGGGMSRGIRGMSPTIG